MTDKPKFRKPLPKRFSASMSEEAYAELRRLAARSNLSNNYVLTALLEYASETIDDAAFDAAVKKMLAASRVD
ncbi:MAG: hypothetical protein AAGJ87_08650 [Pseudomonadota bacterium]